MSCILLMLSHPQSKSFYAAKCEKTIEGGRRRARGILQELEPLVERTIAEADGTANHVRVSREILCCGVKDKIRAERERPLEEGRREGVIDETERPVAMSDLCGCPDVRDPKERIRRRLDPDKPGMPSHHALNLFDVGGFNKRKREAEVLQHAPKQPVGAAVDITRRNDVVPVLEQEHCRRRRPHAGGERQAVLSRLEARKRFLQGRAGRVVRSRVVIALMDAGRALREGARLIDRDGDRPGGGFGLLSDVNGARGKLQRTSLELSSCHQIYSPKCSTTSKRVTIP